LAEDEGFLRRWARRKAEHQTPAEDDATAPLPEAEDAIQENAPPVRVNAAEGEESIDLDALPDIESLDADSDFSIFMQDGIPDALRTRALQKLWRLDPAFGHIDELLDYAEDFNDSATAIASVRSVYEVGKGMLRGGAAGNEAAATAEADATIRSAEETASAEALSAPDHDADAGALPDASTDVEDEPEIAARPGDTNRTG
jgi:hypothetical protein